MDTPLSRGVRHPNVKLNDRLVLFAEPEPRLRELLHLVFQPAGFTGLDAATLPQALRTARTHLPATILFDMHLPSNGGLSAVTRFRRFPLLAGCQIVVISADLEPTLAWQSRQAGADAYLTKPFRPSYLLNLVKELLAVATPDDPQSDGGASRLCLPRSDTPRADGYQLVVPFRAPARGRRRGPSS